jgi:predicted CopG family antitoxin
MINIVSTGWLGDLVDMKTLKVSDEVYRELMNLKIILEAKLKRPVSFDGVLRHMLEATITHPNIEFRSALLGEGLGVEVVRREGNAERAGEAKRGGRRSRRRRGPYSRQQPSPTSSARPPLPSSGTR